MTEIIHLRCDGCGTEEAPRERIPAGWARCYVGLEEYHYCPACWEEVRAHLPWRKRPPEDAVDPGELAHWVAAPMKDVGTSEQFHEVVNRAAELIIRRGRP